MDKRDIDQILDQRYEPKAPSNLSARIIEASSTMPQGRKTADKKSVLAGFAQFLNGFSIPQPALALAAFVVLGVAVVFYSSEVMNPEETSEYYSQSDEVYLAFYLDDIIEVDY